MTVPTRFEILAYTGGKLRVTGFKLPVVVDLLGLEASGEIPVAIKHDTGTATLLGQTDPNEIINDGRQLMLGGPITADPELSPDVKRVIAMHNKGHRWQASIGAEVHDQHDVPAGTSVVINGQEHLGPFTHATKSVLRETSVLGMGADRKTSVTLSAEVQLTLKAEPMDEFGIWCTETLGLKQAPETLEESGRTALASLYAESLRAKADEVESAGVDETAAEPIEPVVAETATEPPVEKKPEEEKGNIMAEASIGLSAEFVAQQTAERKAKADRLRAEAKITFLCKGDSLLEARAIEEGWDEIRTELEVLKKKRVDVPAGHVRSDSPSDTLQAIQGGMLLRAGVAIDNPAFTGEHGQALKLPKWLRAGVNTDQRQKVMEASWKYRDMSMTDLCRAAAMLDGGSSEHIDGSNQGFIRAAVSGGSLANIFTTNINAMFIQKLEEAGDSTQGWTRDADAKNFQTMERTRLVKGGNLTRHKRGGTADHAQRSDLMESYKIHRYSQQFSVDEQDIIDDSFNALKDIPTEMALACGRMRPDLCYSILLANGTLTSTGAALFSASQPVGITGGSAQSNLATGAALAAQTLQNAMAAMFNFRENGVGLSLYPTHLLVPMVLAGTAFNLLQGQNIAVTGSTDTLRGDINPLAALQAKHGKIEVVSDHRLTNGVVDPVTGTAYSGSATTWRMISNKAPTIEVAYLRGSKTPSVRQYELTEGQWGIGWDVKFDLGAKALEWRSFYEGRA